MVKRKIASWLIMISFAIVFFQFADSRFLEGDGVEYGFVVPESTATNKYTPIDSVGDIISSQVTHYQVVNGRFLTHCVVQLFCGILGQDAYAFMNALMFLLLVILVSTYFDVTQDHPGRVLSTTLICFITFFPVRFDPAFQIGYLWVGVAVASFMIMFFKTRTHKAWQIALAGVWAFVVGSLHEAFSIPFGAMLLVWLIQRRFKASRLQWVAGICFAAGMIVELAAPGNYVRLGEFEKSPWLVRPLLELMFLPVAWICLAAWIYRKRYMRKVRSRTIWAELREDMVAPGWGAVMACVFMFLTGLVYRNALIGVNLLLVYLCLRILPRHKMPKWLYAALIIICAVWIPLRTLDQGLSNAKYRHVWQSYSMSDDGIVELPQPYYGVEYRKAEVLASPYVWRLRRDDADAPELHIYPQGLKAIPEHCDTNALIELGGQGWLMIQSKKNPATFTLTKKVGPQGFTDMPFSHRVIDFTPGSLGFVKETDTWSAVAYVNENKWLFSTDIFMMEP